MYPPLLDPWNSSNIILYVIYLFYQVNINLNDRFSFYTLPIYLHRHVGKYSCLVNASHIHSLHLYVDDSYHPSTYPKKLTENVSVIEGKVKVIYPKYYKLKTLFTRFLTARIAVLKVHTFVTRTFAQSVENLWCNKLLLLHHAFYKLELVLKNWCNHLLWYDCIFLGASWN